MVHGTDAYGASIAGGIIISVYLIIIIAKRNRQLESALLSSLTVFFARLVLPRPHLCKEGRIAQSS